MVYFFTFLEYYYKNERNILEFFRYILYNSICKIYASIAQLVECSLGKADVTGSIPVGSSNDVSVRTNRKEQIIIANYLLFRYNLQYKEILGKKHIY